MSLSDLELGLPEKLIRIRGDCSGWELMSLMKGCSLKPAIQYARFKMKKRKVLTICDM